LSYSFDQIVLIFGYIVERTNTNNSLEPFFAISILNPNYDVINDVISGFCKSCRRAMRFSPLDSSEDFMGRCGLRFSLSVIVSELWRHQWRHNDRCGLHPRPWTT